MSRPVAKILKLFAAEFKIAALKIGVVDKEVLSTSDVEALADLPSREILLSQLLGLLLAPATRLVRVLNEPASAFARLLKAKGKGRSFAAATAAPPRKRRLPPASAERKLRRPERPRKRSRSACGRDERRSARSGATEAAEPRQNTTQRHDGTQLKQFERRRQSRLPRNPRRRINHRRDSDGHPSLTTISPRRGWRGEQQKKIVRARWLSALILRKLSEAANQRKSYGRYK